ncbi:HesA/MoeB/ThiF family protein [Sediminibacterium soli]|uniref:HesA/MoeB/ThiF family protein n=1 Tax=Sediminibacterium soli TaxID=2698829 RepID=UPI00137B90F2|nr:HesA/MoeB/ThiF family protein [Sediminibacterium soli]NCI47690.1 hypothetical protein [Sediminibacterium soli]
MKDDIPYTRYHRQMILPGFGAEAQHRLLKASALVVGAGGLGCPVLVSLAGAGLGTIGMVDNGLVELSNLHRQFLYTMSGIGMPKVACAKNALHALNPDITLHTYDTTLTNRNAIGILSQYDIIIDATDNFESRYMLSDACRLLGKPLVFGAVSRLEGQVAVFTGDIGYRDLFPVPPKPGEVAGCSEAGVMGFVTGIIGHMMAGECIKWITGKGQPLAGRLLTYSAMKNIFWETQIEPWPQAGTTAPVSREDFESREYGFFCIPAPLSPLEILPHQFRSLCLLEPVMVYDIREPDELPLLSGLAHERIPVSLFADRFPPATKEPAVFICQSGKRSLAAAEKYRAVYPGHRVYSLYGGVLALTEGNE